MSRGDNSSILCGLAAIVAEGTNASKRTKGAMLYEIWDAKEEDSEPATWSGAGKGNSKEKGRENKRGGERKAFP